jgi:hypothetical protein
MPFVHEQKKLYKDKKERAPKGARVVLEVALSAHDGV